MINWESKCKEFPRLTMTELVYVLFTNKIDGGYGKKYKEIIDHFESNYERVSTTTLKRRMREIRKRIDEENLPDILKNILDTNIKLHNEKLHDSWQKIIDKSSLQPGGAPVYCPMTIGNRSKEDTMGRSVKELTAREKHHPQSMQMVTFPCPIAWNTRLEESANRLDMSKSAILRRLVGWAIEEGRL